MKNKHLAPAERARTQLLDDARHAHGNASRIMQSRERLVQMLSEEVARTDAHLRTLLNGSAIDARALASAQQYGKWQRGEYEQAISRLDLARREAQETQHQLERCAQEREAVRRLRTRLRGEERIELSRRDQIALDEHGTQRHSMRRNEGESYGN